MKVLVLPRDTGNYKRKILVLIDPHCYNLYERLQRDFTVLVKEVLLLVNLPSPTAVKLFKRLDFTF